MKAAGTGLPLLEDWHLIMNQTANFPISTLGQTPALA
jgi:hypothetical protein